MGRSRPTNLPARAPLWQSGPLALAGLRGLLCVGWVVGWPETAVAQANAPSPAELTRALRSLEDQGLRIGLQAAAVDDGAAVGTHRAQESFVPASNQKLWIAAAALEWLGEDFEFQTGLAIRSGQLVLTPGGDPNWRRESDHPPERFLAEVRASLERAGIDRVAGIEVDVASFGPTARGPNWPPGQGHLDYCAPNAPLLFDGATFELEFRATKPGQPAAVRSLAPLGAFTVESRLTTTDDRNAGGRYRVEERDGVLRVSGGFWTKNAPRIVRGAVADPVLVVRRALERQLRAAGITIDPSAQPDATELGQIRSPLRPAIERALRDSSNVDAEQLLRVIGLVRRGDGRADTALPVLRQSIEEWLGQPLTGVHFADGSGLSRDNQVTPQALMSLLLAVAKRPYAATFAASLAEAGSSGTLASRFRDSDLRGRVRAKTGTLAGVSALSGYLRTGSGKVVAFALLVDRSRAKKGAPLMREIEVTLLKALEAGVR